MFVIMMQEQSSWRRFWRKGRLWPLPVGLGVAIGLLLSVVGLMPVPDVKIRWSVPVIAAVNTLGPRVFSQAENWSSCILADRRARGRTFHSYREW